MRDRLCYHAKRVSSPSNLHLKVHTLIESMLRGKAVKEKVKAIVALGMVWSVTTTSAMSFRLISVAVVFLVLLTPPAISSIFRSSGGWTSPTMTSTSLISRQALASSHAWYISTSLLLIFVVKFHLKFLSSLTCCTSTCLHIQNHHLGSSASWPSTWEAWFKTLAAYITSS